MMISDESRRFGDQYGQSFPQLGHKKGRFSLWEYLIRVLLVVGVSCSSTCCTIVIVWRDTSDAFG